MKKNYGLAKSPKNLDMRLDENMSKNEPQMKIPRGYVWEFGVGLIEEPLGKYQNDLEFAKYGRGLVNTLRESLSSEMKTNLIPDLSDLSIRLLQYDSRVPQRKDLLLNSMQKSKKSLLEYLSIVKSEEQIVIGNFLSELSKLKKQLCPKVKKSRQKRDVNSIQLIGRDQLDRYPGINTLTPSNNPGAYFF